MKCKMAVRREGGKEWPPLKGLRHLALRVTDMARSRAFYQGMLGLKVVWEPDPENVYLSSGADNLALHRIPKEDLPGFRTGKGQPLDHFGFLLESPSAVKEMARRMGQRGASLIKPLTTHRDGSVSFYLADPDGNVIQILYVPGVS